MRRKQVNAIKRVSLGVHPTQLHYKVCEACLTWVKISTYVILRIVPYTNGLLHLLILLLESLTAIKG